MKRHVNGALSSILLKALTSVGSSQIADVEENWAATAKTIEKNDRSNKARFRQRKICFLCSSCSSMYNQFASISGPTLTNGDMSFYLEHENLPWLWSWREYEETNK